MDVDVFKRLYGDILRQPLTRTIFDTFGASILTREDLAEFNSPSVLDYQLVGTGETIFISRPSNSGSLPSQLEEKVRPWRFANPFVAEIGPVELIGPNALVVTSTNEYLLENAEGSTIRITDEIIQSSLRGVLPRYRGETNTYDVLVSLVGPWSTEFFHWFADYLPRLQYVETYEAKTGVQPNILLPTEPPEWLLESLDLLGIPSDRMVRWHGGRKNVDKLIVPSLPRHTETDAPEEGYIHSPKALRSLSQELRNAVSASHGKSDSSTRLYVSRALQSNRTVENTSEISSVLSDFGFEIITPEKWTLQQQIKEFARADVIAGPHGAGLINSIYAAEPTLIEFFGRRRNPCYFAIASAMGMNYRCVTGEQVESKIHVPIDDLRGVLEETLD